MFKQTPEKWLKRLTRAVDHCDRPRTTAALMGLAGTSFAPGHPDTAPVAMSRLAELAEAVPEKVNALACAAASAPNPMIMEILAASGCDITGPEVQRALFEPLNRTIPWSDGRPTFIERERMEDVAHSAAAGDWKPSGERARAIYQDFLHTLVIMQKAGCRFDAWCGISSMPRTSVSTRFAFQFPDAARIMGVESVDAAAEPGNMAASNLAFITEAAVACKPSRRRP